MPDNPVSVHNSSNHLTRLQATPYLVLAGLFTLALTIIYLQISLWQHDSAYYDYDSLYIKIKYEGRWLLPWLVYPLKQLNGQLVLLIDLAALFFFFYSVAKRISKQTFYALIFAALCIQIPAHAYQLMWPTNTAPSILILALAPLLVGRLNVFWFYLIFGTLLFATASNYYYLLPLLHLSLLNRDSVIDNLKLACFKLIPAWGLGFIVGYIISLLAVYAYTYSISGVGQWGIEIKAWRRPNKLENMADLMTNIESSYTYFKVHLESVFLKPWTWAVAAIALITRLLLGARKEVPAILLVCTAMMVSHYVITLPVGIRIDLRTVVNLWMALFALLFLANFKSQQAKHIQVMMLAMVLLSYSYLRENIHNLKDYSEISNFYYDDFTQVLEPSDVDAYRGVVFMSTHRQVYEANLSVLQTQNLDNGKIVWLNTDTRLAPNAYKFGFENIYLCGSSNRRTEFCQDLVRSNEDFQQLNRRTDRLHKVTGVYRDFLVIELQAEALK